MDIYLFKIHLWYSLFYCFQKRHYLLLYDRDLRQTLRHLVWPQWREVMFLYHLQIHRLIEIRRLRQITLARNLTVWQMVDQQVISPLLQVFPINKDQVSQTCTFLFCSMPFSYFMTTNNLSTEGKLGFFSRNLHLLTKEWISCNTEHRKNKT